MGRALGIDERKLLELHEYRTSDAFAPLERLVLEYAERMTKTPAVVPDELVARLREHLEPNQLVELTATIATENWIARFNRALGVESQDFAEGAACPLPPRE